jgi:hypothetical protein
VAVNEVGGDIENGGELEGHHGTHNLGARLW